eukprot:GHVR01016835.1.p1 GENE.GHVR01016835.1~~GHVR01016835.1.p1  ORF type:complete len:146 (+),score=13.92 GHVR01016835.1:295-732(+)
MKFMEHYFLCKHRKLLEPLENKLEDLNANIFEVTSNIKQEIHKKKDRYTAEMAWMEGRYSTDFIKKFKTGIIGSYIKDILSQYDGKNKPLVHLQVTSHIYIYIYIIVYIIIYILNRLPMRICVCIHFIILYMYNIIYIYIQVVVS